MTSPEVQPEPTADPVIDRDLSWLAFNGRVLQEAMDPSVPLADRLAFLAIFSSNLDEFFRVRVAALRALLRLKKKKRKSLDFHPGRLLREIQRVVSVQQEAFGHTLRTHILPGMEAHGIRVLQEDELSEHQREWARTYFHTEVAPHLSPIILDRDGPAPFLDDGGIYLAVELWPGGNVGGSGYQASYGIVEIPSHKLSRFVELPGPGTDVMYLDDVVRLGLSGLFAAHEVAHAYSVKLTRDADLYLDDEFSGDLVEKIRKSLDRRKTGVPSRFLYDLRAPYAMIACLKDALRLEDDDLIPGGRYHNLTDLFGFPIPDLDQGSGDPPAPTLTRPPLPPLPHPILTGVDSVLAQIREADQVLHFPYQSYEPVLRFFDEAASDPDVTEIGVTLYRVAGDSRVVRALMDAARAGKRVRAFVEVKARFDEARNLHWAAEMEAAGVETTYSMPGLKVHSKVAVVTRVEDGVPRRYAFLGTGNFNESTATIYADHALLTAHPGVTEEAWAVLDALCDSGPGQGDPEGVLERLGGKSWDHLLVAPTHMRARFAELIEAEREAAGADGPSGMTLKMNSLEDPGMIDLLYRASRAGVPIRMVVRGIFRLVAGQPDLSEHIQALSIVDRYLEHARVYRFHAGGDDLLYLASADWMRRNLDRRVEVGFPLLDPSVREQILAITALQLGDNAKARILDGELGNAYAGRDEGEPRREAQMETYRYLSDLGSAPV